MQLRTLTAMSMLVLATGCATQQTFHVTVKNATDGPITVGLVKEGDPFQRAWASPEAAAINGEKPDAEMWAAIPAGKTVDTGQVKGRFRSNARAILRVYQGDLKLADILAISRGQPNRYDLVLHPGEDRVVVFDREGQIIAVESEPRPTSSADR
jgi:hypothetical protein